jgi:TetR/AcrR family transcriptional regulator, repressor for neighboring sulfatase
VVASPRGRAEVTAAVLDAAERLFVRSGPSSVSLRDIAREAHVNLGLIHRHIGSKDDLVRAVFRRFMQQGLQRMQGVGDWSEVVELVFTPTTDYVNYTHLLGWLLLEGADPAVLAEDGSPLPVVVQRAAAETGDLDQARTLVVGLLSMAYGWQVFAPYFRQALGSGEESTALAANLAAFGAGLLEKSPTP